MILITDIINSAKINQFISVENCIIAFPASGIVCCGVIKVSAGIALRALNVIRHKAISMYFSIYKALLSKFR